MSGYSATVSLDFEFDHYGEQHKIELSHVGSEDFVPRSKIDLDAPVQGRLVVTVDGVENARMVHTVGRMRTGEPVKYFEVTREITLEELQTSYDWEEVFGEGSCGNTTPVVETVDGTPCDPCPRSEVAEIIAAVNGEHDEDDWVGVFRMKDGRFLLAVAGCDYTGWDCRADNDLTVAASLDALIQMALTPEQCKRLGILHPANEVEP